MSVPTVRRISDMSRVQEHGRIRFGVKGARYPKALNTFRFTSPDKVAIEQIAEIYGGDPQPWSDRSARIQNQFEVITEASSIDVWVPPDSVSCSYEMWTAAGCQRRCDGETCTLLDVEEPQPCVCLAKNLRECKPKTRFSVVLPAIDFGGVWRGESGSWDAMEEMTSMMSLIDAVRDHGQPFLICRLILQDMKKTTKGETHRWKYPKLIPTDSMQNIVTGATSFTALTQSNDGRVHPMEIESRSVHALGTTHADTTYVEVVDVEIIEEESWPTFTAAARDGIKRAELEKRDNGRIYRRKEPADDNQPKESP